MAPPRSEHLKLVEVTRMPRRASPHRETHDMHGEEGEEALGATGHVFLVGPPRTNVAIMPEVSGQLRLPHVTTFGRRAPP